MKILFVVLAILVSVSNTYAKTKSKKLKKAKKAPVVKINYEDAKEHCLITKGAAISNIALENCIKETMNSKMHSRDLAI